MNTKTLSLKSPSGWVDFETWRGLNAFNVSLNGCFALVLNRNFRKLGFFEWRWLGVFIASNHFLAFGWPCCRWAHRTVRWRTGQPLFTVRCAPRQRARWGLELLTVWTVCHFAAPDSLVPHRTCPVTSDLCALTSTRHSSSLFPFAVDRWCAGTIAPLAHRTCPVHTGQFGEL
jgi:hypothetical protein